MENNLYLIFKEYQQKNVRVTFKDGANGTTGSHVGRLDALSHMGRDKIMVALGQPDEPGGGIIFMITDHKDSELFVETA